MLSTAGPHSAPLTHHERSSESITSGRYKDPKTGVLCSEGGIQLASYPSRLPSASSLSLMRLNDPKSSVDILPGDLNDIRRRDMTRLPAADGSTLFLQTHFRNPLVNESRYSDLLHWLSTVMTGDSGKSYELMTAKPMTSWPPTTSRYLKIGLSGQPYFATCFMQEDNTLAVMLYNFEVKQLFSVITELCPSRPLPRVLFGMKSRDCSIECQRLMSEISSASGSIADKMWSDGISPRRLTSGPTLVISADEFQSYKKASCTPAFQANSFQLGPVPDNWEELLRECGASQLLLHPWSAKGADSREHAEYATKEMFKAAHDACLQLNELDQLSVLSPDFDSLCVKMTKICAHDFPLAIVDFAPPPSEGYSALHSVESMSQLLDSITRVDTIDQNDENHPSHWTKMLVPDELSFPLQMTINVYDPARSALGSGAGSDSPSLTELPVGYRVLKKSEESTHSGTRVHVLFSDFKPSDSVGEWTAAEDSLPLSERTRLTLVRVSEED